MILNLSEQTSNVVLDSMSKLMDGGSIELMSDGGEVLAVLQLSSPAAQTASGGELAFNAIAQDFARAQGSAETARILGPDGSEIFSCDVGDKNSDAVIKLNTIDIAAGGSVAIGSFKLVMP